MIGDNQNFSITTDTLQVIDKIRFEGSPENTAFLGFQKVMTSATQKSRQIKEAMEKDPAKTSPEAKKKYSARFDQIDKEVRDHIAGLCKQFPNSALATLPILHSPFLLLIFQKKYLKIPPTGILKYKKKNTSFQRHIIGTILIFRTVL